MEVKKDTQFDALVKMTLSADGSAKTGLVYTDVTIYLQKQGGSSTVKNLSGASEWVEVDSTNIPGVYRLRFSTTDHNTLGFNVFGVAATNCNKFIGVLEIVENLESDSVSAIAAIESGTAYIGGRV